MPDLAGLPRQVLPQLGLIGSAVLRLSVAVEKTSFATVN
jgi:hypothetical protein